MVREPNGQGINGQGRTGARMARTRTRITRTRMARDLMAKDGLGLKWPDMNARDSLARHSKRWELNGQAMAGNSNGHWPIVQKMAFMAKLLT